MTTRTTHLPDPHRAGFCLCGEQAHADTTTDAPRSVTCYYCLLEWERAQDRRTAARKETQP